MIVHPITGKGGGLTPEIRVTAPTGSTVTAKKRGSSIVISPTVIEGTPNSTYIFFNLDIAIYDITGTLNSKSQTLTVNIDKVALWDETIDFVKLWLYDGNRMVDKECEAVTGGWQGGYKTSGFTFTKNENSFRLQAVHNISSVYGYIIPLQKVDISGYSTLKVNIADIYFPSVSNTGYFFFGISDSDISTTRNYRNSYAAQTRGLNSLGVNTLDISRFSGDKSIYFCADAWDLSVDVTVDGIWLE